MQAELAKEYLGLHREAEGRTDEEPQSARGGRRYQQGESGSAWLERLYKKRLGIRQVYLGSKNVNALLGLSTRMLWIADALKPRALILGTMCARM